MELVMATGQANAEIMRGGVSYSELWTRAAHSAEFG